MLRNRARVSSADIEELKQFYQKSKKSIKIGLYYDSLAKKYKRLDTKEVAKFENYKKRLTAKEQDVLTNLQNTVYKNFKEVNKKNLRKDIQNTFIQKVSGEKQKVEQQKKEEETVTTPYVKKTGGPIDVPTNIKVRRKKNVRGKDMVESIGEEGGIAQTKLKKRTSPYAHTPEKDNMKKLEKDMQKMNLDEQKSKVSKSKVDEETPLESASNVEVTTTAKTQPVSSPSITSSSTIPPPPGPPPKSARRRRIQPIYGGETKENPPPENAPQNPQSQNIETQTENIEMEVKEQEGPILQEVTKAPPGSKAFVSPAAERVSMERNRMKYSPKKLYEEIKAFVKIYNDDIKTESFKKLVEESKKVNEKSPAVKLRKLHRHLEEEIIEYYQGKNGLRLGLIIDPAVMGIDVGQLQGILQPNMANFSIGNQVRRLEHGQSTSSVNKKITQDVEVHYQNGGLKHATNAVMPEGQNLQEHTDSIQFNPRRINVPIQPKGRFLFRPKNRVFIPENIKIK
jgi:hypothetical protein